MPRKLKLEPSLRLIVAIVAVIAVPVLIALVALANFSGLTDATALNHSQLARHFAAGDGFVSSVLQPVVVAQSASGQAAPDLVSAPVQPALLALVFRWTAATDRIVALTGLGVWVLTVWLLFWIARYWWDWRTAGLAMVFLCVQHGGLMAAAAGLPQPVLALLVLGAVAAVFPKRSKSTEGEPQLAELAPWQFAVAGLLCGLAALTDYRLLPLALVLGAYVFITQEHRRRWLALKLFIVGLVVVLVPWCIRNLLVSGRLFGFYWYVVLENTREFPGETIWRLTNVPAHPLLYLLLHPLDVLRKLALGLAQYRRAGLGLLEPVTLLLCIGALFSAPAQTSRRRLAVIALSGAVLTVLFSCLTRPDGQLLLPWEPVLGCVAAAQLVAWVQTHVNSFSSAKGRVRLGVRPMRSLTYTGLIVLTAFPAVMQFSRNSTLSTTNQPSISSTLSQRLPARGVVLTDAPAFVAWYLDRPALLLCQRETDLTELEKKTGKIAGIYLSPALANLSLPERGEWWIWMASSRGLYRDLELVPNSPLPGLLRLPQDTKTQMTAELELDRFTSLQQSRHEDLQSADAQTQLAFAYLSMGRLRDAQRIYQEVCRQDPNNIEARIGWWQAVAQLTQPDGTLRLAQLVAQVPLHDPRAKLLLEQAAAHFEQTLVQHPTDPWLLMNLIICRARLGQWSAAEAAYARLVQPLPKTFPARLLLANLYLEQGESEKAATAVTQLLQEHLNLPIVHQLAGRVWLAQDKLEDALKEFDATVQLRPQWIDSQRQAGQICYRLQRYDAGAKYIEAALKLAPTLVKLKLDLADIYDAQGKTAATIGLYREVLATDAKEPIALNNLAGLLAKTGQGAEALLLARQAVDLNPLNPHFRDTLGWVAFLTGNRNEALVHLSEAVRLAPNQGLLHFHLGKVLLGLGQPAEARQAFKWALECGLPAVEQQEAQTATTAK